MMKKLKYLVLLCLVASSSAAMAYQVFNQTGDSFHLHDVNHYIFGISQKLEAQEQGRCSTNEGLFGSSCTGLIMLEAYDEETSLTPIFNPNGGMSVGASTIHHSLCHWSGEVNEEDGYFVISKTAGATIKGDGWCTIEYHAQ